MRPSLQLHIVCIAVVLISSSLASAPADGLRFSDEAGRAEAAMFQQHLQKLAGDRGADVTGQADDMARRIVRIISQLDLSRPAIPKAGNVCTELLGPWFDQGPVLQDTNMLPMQQRVRFGRSLTAKCFETVRTHLLRNAEVIGRGMQVWIATKVARADAVSTAQGWCTGYGAQNEWWPLRSFYPDDLIEAVVAACRAGAGNVLTRAAEQRVNAAIEEAGRVDRTLEAMAAAKWLPMPALGIGDPALARSMKERYEAAVVPIRREVTDEIVSNVEEAYGGKLAVDRPIRAARVACHTAWSKTLFSSPEDGMRVIDKACREAEAAFMQRACRHGLDQASVERLGWSKLMVFARANGTLAPVDFNATVCAAAIDGFTVAIESSWVPLSMPALKIAPATGGPAVTLKLRKLTRDAGVAVWVVEDAAGSAPLTSPADIMTCLATPIDQSDATAIARGLGYAAGLQMSLADVMGGIGVGIDAIQCRTLKRSWLERAA